MGDGSITKEAWELMKNDVLANAMLCTAISGMTRDRAWIYTGVAAAGLHPEDGYLYTVNFNIAIAASYVHLKATPYDIYEASKSLMELFFTINCRVWWFNTPSNPDPKAAMESWLVDADFPAETMELMKERMDAAVEAAKRIGLPPDLLRLDDIEAIATKIVDATVDGSTEEGKMDQDYFKGCIDSVLGLRKFYLSPEFLTEQLGFVRVLQPPGYAVVTTQAHQVGGMSALSVAWNMAPSDIIGAHVAKEFAMAKIWSKKLHPALAAPFERNMCVSSVAMEAAAKVKSSIDPEVKAQTEALDKAATLVHSAAAHMAKIGDRRVKSVRHGEMNVMMCSHCFSPLAKLGYFFTSADCNRFINYEPPKNPKASDKPPPRGPWCGCCVCKTSAMSVVKVTW